MMLQKVPLFSEQMIQKLWDNNNESHHADIDDISCSCEIMKWKWKKTILNDNYVQHCGITRTNILLVRQLTHT